MISDAEQRKLVEIENLLRLEDPAFVRRFDERPCPPRRARAIVRTATLAALAIVVALAVAAVAVAWGGPLAAVLAVCVITTMWAGVVLRRRRARPRRRLS